jgi:hypothetical protein
MKKENEFWFLFLMNLDETSTRENMTFPMFTSIKSLKFKSQSCSLTNRRSSDLNRNSQLAADIEVTEAGSSHLTRLDHKSDILSMEDTASRQCIKAK